MHTVATLFAAPVERPILLDPRIPHHRPLIRRIMLLTPPTPSIH